MGWTYYNATHYKNGKVDRKAEMDDLFNWSDPDAHMSCAVLKSAMVGSTYYAAVRSENSATGYDEIAAVICLTHVDSKSYCNFGYKDMDETMGPFKYGCPKSILKLLSPTDNVTANDWRQECWNRHAIQDRIPQKAKRVCVTFDHSIKWPCYVLPAGTPAEFEKKHYYKRRPAWYLAGTYMYLAPGKIYDATSIEILEVKQ